MALQAELMLRREERVLLSKQALAVDFIRKIRFFAKRTNSNARGKLQEAGKTHQVKLFKV